MKEQKIYRCPRCGSRWHTDCFDTPKEKLTATETNMALDIEDDTILDHEETHCQCNEEPDEEEQAMNSCKSCGLSFQ